MTLNSSIRYHQNQLYCDDIPIADIVQSVGTPTYIYSLKRILSNYRRLKTAFDNRTQIHYSAKANTNLHILRALIQNGAGIDAVSGGEVYAALQAGAKPQDIVFAGVGKNKAEIQYAVEQGVGWFNIENVLECQYINDAANTSGRDTIQVALRLNPDVTPNTHPYISTGHGGAKFGLMIDTIHEILQNQEQYPRLKMAGLHVHVGSQLHDTDATNETVEKILALAEAYPQIQTINLGGGFPVAYRLDEEVPPFESFATLFRPLLDRYKVILEPGRAIVADAGILVTEILYVKKQADQTFLIVDASMSELIRPALYQAHHAIIPIQEYEGKGSPTQVAGPVCESADIFGADRPLPEMKPGDLLAILTTGAYGMVMASNYNMRPRPAEVIVTATGGHWQISKNRESWDSMLVNATSLL